MNMETYVKALLEDKLNEIEERQWHLESRMEREADPENRLRHDWELLEMRKKELLAL